MSPSVCDRKISTDVNQPTLVPERYAPAKTLTAVNTKCLTFNENASWEWMDLDGAALRKLPNVDAYEGTLFLYSDLTTDRRNVHGRIENITV